MLAKIFKKIMMKKLVAFCVIVLTVLVTENVNAQKWKLGVAVVPGIASNGGYGFVLGADARLQTNIVDKTYFILSTGVTEFFKKDPMPGFGYIPVKPGVKFFFAENAYAAGEIGIGFGLVKGSGRSFLWSPSVGLSFKDFDISLKYEEASDFGKYTKFFGLRVAKGFDLK